MGEEQLLQLAQQFLFSKAGKKLIGDDIDLNSLENQIKSELQSQIQDLQAKATEIDVTKKPEKSREERKKDRQDRRNKKREDREKRREERKEEREKRAEERKERGGTIGQFIPKFRTYITTGRVYDTFTKEPIEGAKTQIVIKDPITETYIPISENVDRDDEENFIPGIATETDETGKYKIAYRLPYLPYNNKLLVEAYVLYTKGDYLPIEQALLTGNREVKDALPPFPMVSLAQAADEALPTYLGEYYPIYKNVRNTFLAPKEQAIIFRKRSILKIIDIIQTRLIPIAIGLLLTFGITKLSQRNQKVCPSTTTLESNVERRNRIVRQLNQIFKKILLQTGIAAALTAIAAAAKSGKETISNLQLPLSVPPGIGVPYSVVSKLQAVEAVLAEAEEANKELNKQIVTSLILLTSSLTTILILLKLLDELTEECANELNIQPEAISQELLDLSEEAEEEGVSGGVQIVNGFTLEVQTIESNQVGDLKRRQAIGKNSQGVIQVKGDPSFSSSDQILLNELAFYIQSNNLKAY